MNISPVFGEGQLPGSGGDGRHAGKRRKNPVTGLCCAQKSHLQNRYGRDGVLWMYGQSGEFLVRTGMPAKSGVGGGIMSAIPGKGGLGVVGPALNENGQQRRGIELLSRLSDEMDLSICKKPELRRKDEYNETIHPRPS